MNGRVFRGEASPSDREVYAHHPNLITRIGGPDRYTLPMQVFASLDIMLSASRQEGLPMSMLEGMASGLPLISMAVGEVPSVVQDGRTGILVPPGDPIRLSDAVFRLLRDRVKLSQMGATGRKLIRDEFSAERMTDSYLTIYDDALASMIPRTPRGRIT